MELKKAFGTVTALGTELGQRVKTQPGLIGEVRAVEGAPAMREKLQELYAGTRVEALAKAFADHITDEDWKAWRSRLLLQAKMVAEGGKPAPGHEKGGKGTAGPSGGSGGP